MTKIFKKRRDDYGIEAMRKKRLTQVHQKAKMLREYAKTCKREGVDSERVNLGPKQNTDSKPKKTNHVASESKASLIKLYKEVSETKLQQSQQRDDSAKTDLSMRTNKDDKAGTKDRKDRFRRHTKTGQPMLALQSKSLLDKINLTVVGKN